MTAANITNLPAVNVAPLPVRTGGNLIQAIIPRTYGDVDNMAGAVCAAGIAPKFGNDRSRVAAIMMSGMEVGLKPLAALRLFYMTPEGQPALLARGMLAVVQSSGMLEYWEDRFEGEGDDRRAVVICKRRGFPAITRVFSRAEGKKAGLMNKQNWSKYEDRMLWNRAVSYALNDAFADLLGGLYDPSELGGPVVDDAGEILLPPAAIEPAKINTAPPPATFAIKVPYGGQPATYPRTRGGAKEAFAEIVAEFNDGYHDVVALNLEILDEIAERIPALAPEIARLRAEAAEISALAAEPEPEPEEREEKPDTFVRDFVNGDDDTFPGDLPNKTEEA